MYVPQSQKVNPKDIDKLLKFICDAQYLCVLTGAGMSTESGLPDYRSEKVGLYARSKHRPMMYQDFLRSAKARQRYWARNFAGWFQTKSVKPNEGHEIIADWQKRNIINGLITQNVDGLHKASGSTGVLELHGCLADVLCLNCGSYESRESLQKRFMTINDNWESKIDQGFGQMAPDGDVFLPDELVVDFNIPTCLSCEEGILKPDVVFFGDNVPTKKRDLSFELIDKADHVLCIGTSLYVYSAYRLVRKAHDEFKPVASLTVGKTRADELIDLCISSNINEVLSLCDKLL